MPTDELSRRLEAIRGKRGYLLAHHGLMAVTMPELLESYDKLYTHLALTERRLTRHEHEFVWMAILVAEKEALGTHHIARFRDAGGTDEELARILAITAMAIGCPAYEFIDAHWRPHLPDFDGRRRYLDAFRAAAAGSPIELAHMAAAGVFTSIGNWVGLEWQICAAYEDGVDEHGLAEALSLAMFPGGVPNYVDAADVWRELVVSGRVQASPEFETWARLSGQGGYDEASGVAAPREGVAGADD